MRSEDGLLVRLLFIHIHAGFLYCDIQRIVPGPDLYTVYEDTWTVLETETDSSTIGETGEKTGPLGFQKRTTSLVVSLLSTKFLATVDRWMMIAI